MAELPESSHEAALEGNVLRNFSPRLVRIACVAILSVVAASAQQNPDPAIAPVPPALLAAKRIFVSNAGADSGLFPHPFTGNPDRAYNQFYAGLQGWGQYDLVSDPQEADLVFELRLSAPNGPTEANKQKGASDPLPMLGLVILDRKTHYILWALTESILPANLQKTHDHNFDEAIETLILDLKKLTGKSTAAAP